MKSAKESGCFPYSSSVVCYIEVYGDGRIMQIHHDQKSISKAYSNAKNNKTKIYAVWPGNYRSDLFEIDDLNALADAYGVRRHDDHVHSLRWKLSPYDDGTSRYAEVDVVFECGCTIEYDNIKKIANDLREQMGWDMATSTGWSCHSDIEGTEYTISVRRSCL